MAHPLSGIGIVHTLISVVPVVSGVYGLLRFRFIDPRTTPGKIYLGSLSLSVLTSFALSSTGGFNPGHALGIMALLAAFGATALGRSASEKGVRPYLCAFGLSFSFFLLMVPGINETLTRLPAGHPLADGPQSPLVMHSLLAWLLLFVVGYSLQFRSIRSRRKL